MMTAFRKNTGFAPNPTAALVFIVTLTLVFLIVLRPPADPDMWWHLSAGRVMMAEKAVLSEDVFSYTRAGEPWVNAFWISDLLLYLAFAVGGFTLILVLVALLAALTMLVVYAQAEGPLLVRAGVVLLAALVMAPVWTARPQVMSFFLVALLDFFLSCKEESLDKAYWLLLPLFALWPNLHGGFIFGFLLLIAFFTAKLVEPWISSEVDWRVRVSKLRPWVLFSSLAVFAVGLNPNGLAIWKLPFNTVDVSLWIQEWHSPNFHRIDRHPILWLLFTVMAAMALSGTRVRLYDVLKVVGFAYLALYAQRGMALFAIAAAPVAVRYLNIWWQDAGDTPLGVFVSRLQEGEANKPLPKRFARLINLTVVCVLLAACLYRAYHLSRPEVVHQSYPKAAVEWIEGNQPEGRMLNTYNWGGYLTWILPSYPVFIDGRADLYGDELIQAWWRIVNAEAGATVLLDSYEIRFVFLEPGWPIAEALSNQGWVTSYEDGQSLILSRP